MILDPLHNLPPRYLALFLLAALGCAYVFYQRFLSPLAGIPGPFWASLSRWWMVKHAWGGDMHLVMIELHKQHGKLVRTGPNEVSVSDLDSIKTIYGAGSKFRKSDWYSVFQGHRKFDLFPERDEKLHASQRRLVSRAYAMETLKDLQPYVNNAINVFMEKMIERKDQAIDLGTWVQLFAIDVIGEVTFSRSLGYMERGSDDGSLAAIENALGSAAWIGQVPWLYWLNDFLVPVLGNRLAIAARHGRLLNFAIAEVAGRKDRGSDRKDILSKLFAVQKDKPLEMDDNAVRNMAAANIFAGSDTTAISTKSIIYHLLKHEEYKERLVAEIEQFHKDGLLSNPVTLEEADRMPFLQAVMYEALRCHPATGLSLPRVVPAGGATIAGRFFPPGTIVGANAWVIHRDKTVFGEDADIFNPDRWLRSDKSDMLRFFFAFGAGARTCIGRNISWMEMSKLIPTLFHNFDMQLVEPDVPLKEICWWFVFNKGLNVYMKPKSRTLQGADL